MTRLAKTLALALTIALLAVSSAAARAPHSAEPAKDTSDTAAIAIVAGLGLLIGASALVPLGRRRGTAAQS
jgi:hypothetical protein